MPTGNVLWSVLGAAALIALAVLPFAYGRRSRSELAHVVSVVVQQAALLCLLWNLDSLVTLVAAQVVLLLSNMHVLAIRRAGGAARPRLSRSLVDAAVSVERTRIARKLHDIVGNNLTVISLQARAGGGAEGRLESIDATAQRTMRQVGSIVRRLRSGPVAAEDTPTSLIATVRLSIGEVALVGAQVRLRVSGSDLEPPAGVLDLVRRLVTEALVNGLKHGPYTEARVELTLDDAIDLRILTRGGEAAAGADGAPRLTGFGLGLRGLAEQLWIFGGGLDSGHLPDGWFHVTARIPLVWNKPREVAPCNSRSGS